MPDPENLTPEVQTSPVSELVQQLCGLVSEVLDDRGVETATAKDGTVTRQITDSNGATLIESINPQGIKSYEKSTLFYHSGGDSGRDRGAYINRWQENSAVLEFEENSEVRGIKTKTITDQDQIRQVISNVEYVIGHLPEKTPPPRSKRRWKLLGRRAIKT